MTGGVAAAAPVATPHRPGPPAASPFHDRVRRQARTLARWAGGLAAAIARIVFAALDLVWPKDDRLVAFSHRDFTDNSRALFEFIAAGGSPLRAVWLADTPAQRRRMLAQVPLGRILLKRSLAGLVAALRARTLAFSFYPEEFRPYSAASGRKRVVMLWHAVSIKRSKLLSRLLTDAEKDRYRRRSATYSLMIASSDLDRLAKAAAHGVDARRVAVTGLPRTDRVIAGAALRPALPRAVAAALAGRAILYAPTYRPRGSTTELFRFDDFDAAALDEALAAMDATILIRPHKNDRRNLARAEGWADAGLTRLIGLTSAIVPDVADVLADIDVLMTDYSSIMLDFLLLDRPMLFLPYDWDRYAARHGLLYDYDVIAPGPRIASQAELVAALRSALAGAPEFAARRALSRRMFHAFDDGQSTRRVAGAIERLALGPSRGATD